MVHYASRVIDDANRGSRSRAVQQSFLLGMPDLITWRVVLPVVLERNLGGKETDD